MVSARERQHHAAADDDVAGRRARRAVGASDTGPRSPRRRPRHAATPRTTTSASVSARTPGRGVAERDPGGDPRERQRSTGAAAVRSAAGWASTAWMHPSAKRRRSRSPSIAASSACMASPHSRRCGGEQPDRGGQPSAGDVADPARRRSHGSRGASDPRDASATRCLRPGSGTGAGAGARAGGRPPRWPRAGPGRRAASGSDTACRPAARAPARGHSRGARPPDLARARRAPRRSEVRGDGPRA